MYMHAVSIDPELDLDDMPGLQCQIGKMMMLCLPSCLTLLSTIQAACRTAGWKGDRVSHMNVWPSCKSIRIPHAVQDLLAALWASQPVPHERLAAGRAHASVPARLEDNVCPSLPAHHAVHILNHKGPLACLTWGTRWHTDLSIVGASAAVGAHVVLDRCRASSNICMIRSAVIWIWLGKGLQR